MKFIYSIIVSLFVVGCQTKPQNNVELVIVNHSDYDTALFHIDEISCKDVFKEQFGVNIKGIKRVQTIQSNQFIQLTIESTNDIDRVEYNMEIFRINDLDTLRIANFGHGQMTINDDPDLLKLSLCKFLNK